VAGDAVLTAPVSGKISLQTGNFTGKYAVLELAETVSAVKTAVPQRLFEYFPKRINRENSSRNWESSRRYQGIEADNLVSVHFSHTFPTPGKHDLFSFSICR
jgi:hypothetical protein